MESKGFCLLLKAYINLGCSLVKITKLAVKVEFSFKGVYNDKKHIKDEKYGKRKHFKKR